MSHGKPLLTTHFILCYLYQKYMHLPIDSELLVNDNDSDLYVSSEPDHEQMDSVIGVPSDSIHQG